MKKQNIIVLIGAPCSGKSTIGKAIVNDVMPLLDIRYEYISSGNIARGMAEADAIVHNDLLDGKLAPEYAMRNAIREAIINSSREIIILDGFPRFGDQAKWLEDNFGSDPNYSINYVLFDTSIQTIMERSASRNREDDISIERRIKYYSDVTYRELKPYIDITISTDNNSIDECTHLLKLYILSIVRRCN